MRKIITLIAFTLLSLNAYSLADEVTTNSKIIMAENNPVASTACKAYRFINSGITKAIITLLCIITGLGFFIGKISWGIVISLIIGTSLTLTSGKLVGIFVGDAGRGGGDGHVCECKHGLEDQCKNPINN